MYQYIKFTANVMIDTMKIFRIAFNKNLKNQEKLYYSNVKTLLIAE